MNEGGTPSPPVPAPAPWSIAAAGGAIVAAGLVAYHNTYSAPFLFDDDDAITANPSIHQLWPPWAALFPPSGGSPTAGRPLANVSFAINHALGGFEVWGYHAANLAIHLLAGLTLFGLVRRTLLLPRLRERFGGAALMLAFAIALLWTVHPLQTESVTYLSQRAESLVGLFYLLTLYCFIRGVDSSRPSGWHVLSVTACFAGMAGKEVMISAPLIVLCYDRTFVAGTVRESWRRRRSLYIGLAASWLLLAWLVGGMGGRRGTTAGFGLGMPWWSYAFAQCDAILHYLGLAVWPHPLVFDYGTYAVRDVTAVLPQALLLGCLLAGTAAALWRRTAWGFTGAFFFAVLAPSSSVVPIVTQTMAEHRMYLALAAVVVPAVFGLYGLVGRRSLFGCLALALAFGTLTIRRNEAYQSDASIWADTIAKCPQNPRAFDDYGLALANLGRLDEAASSYREAVRLNPSSPYSLENLGLILVRLGKFEEAKVLLQAALRLKPDSAASNSGLAVGYFQTGDFDNALRRLQESVRLEPTNPVTRRNLAAAFYRLGQAPEALGQFQLAARLDPTDIEARNHGGAVALSLGQNEVAIALEQEAVRLNPGNPAARNTLAAALNAAGRFTEAVAQSEFVLRSAPDSPEAHYNLGESLLHLGRTADAIVHYEAALRPQPNRVGAQTGVGDASIRSGRPADALASPEFTMRLEPDLVNARKNLGVALLQLGRPGEAVPHFQEALRLNPNRADTHNNLGVAFLRLGRIDDATAEFNAALRVEPGFADAARNLAAARAMPAPSTPPAESKNQ